jgi:hypothetical protein
VWLDAKSVHLSIGDFLADGVIPIVKDGLHRQAWGGRCATDKGQQRGPGAQRHAGPVATYLAE